MEKSKTATILITGATGNIGTELTKLLSVRKMPFRAMVRNRKDAKALAELEGAEIVVGDFDDSESVAKALQGMERAFLLTNSSERAETQQTDFVEAAQRAGIKHLVKQSQWAADVNSPVRFLRYHAAVESKISYPKNASLTKDTGCARLRAKRSLERASQKK